MQRCKWWLGRRVTIRIKTGHYGYQEGVTWGKVQIKQIVNLSPKFQTIFPIKSGGKNDNINNKTTKNWEYKLRGMRDYEEHGLDNSPSK